MSQDLQLQPLPTPPIDGTTLELAASDNPITQGAPGMCVECQRDAKTGAEYFHFELTTSTQLSPTFSDVILTAHYDDDTQEYYQVTTPGGTVPSLPPGSRVRFSTERLNEGRTINASKEQVLGAKRLQRAVLSARVS